MINLTRDLNFFLYFDKSFGIFHCVLNCTHLMFTRTIGFHQDIAKCAIRNAKTPAYKYMSDIINNKSNKMNVIRQL
jgi:hypothetical protein